MTARALQRKDAPWVGPDGKERKLIVREASGLEILDYREMAQSRGRAGAIAFQIRERVLDSETGQPAFTTAEALALAQSPIDNMQPLTDLMTLLNSFAPGEKKASPQ